MLAEDEPKAADDDAPEDPLQPLETSSNAPTVAAIGAHFRGVPVSIPTASNLSLCGTQDGSSTATYTVEGKDDDDDSSDGSFVTAVTAPQQASPHLHTPPCVGTFLQIPLDLALMFQFLCKVH